VNRSGLLMTEVVRVGGLLCARAEPECLLSVCAPAGSLSAALADATDGDGSQWAHELLY
jgi:hypothetical protein